MTDRGPARIWRLRIAALGLAFAISIVLGEVALRLLGVAYPVLVEPEPVAGIRLRPFVEGWFTEEGEGYVVANDIGYRDRVHPLAKPPGHFRIAVLGDSYTEALQVPLEQVWWILIEQGLASCAGLDGRRPEVVNFAISGIGTAQQYEIYRQIARHYEPDVVVLAFVANDVPNNHPAFGGAGTKPFYTFDAAGELVLDDSFKESPAYLRSTGLAARVMRGLTDYSHVVQLLLEGRRALNRREIAAAQQRSGGSMSAPPKQQKWIEAWRVTEALLVRMARTVRGDGSDFLLVAVSSPHQIHPSAEYRRHRLEQVEQGEDLLYWNKRLAQLARNEGFDFLSLSEPLGQIAARDGVCLHGFDNMLPCDGHWNREGHTRAAQYVEAELCALASSETASAGAK